jgi:hypothetical protein
VDTDDEDVGHQSLFSPIDPGFLQTDEELDTDDEMDFDAPVVEKRLPHCPFILTEAEEGDELSKRTLRIDSDSD